VTVDTPIVLVGESAALKEASGTVDQLLHTLSVNSTPGNIPNEITIDISDLGVGDSIRVGDLKLPSGVTTDVDPEEAVAIGQVTRATIEAEQLEEEAAAEAVEEGDEPTAEGEGGDEAAEPEAGSEE
jgi:large subunit ribosomal protein L25